MSVWYNYTVILPLLDEYNDDGSRDLFSIPLEIKNVGRFEASAVGTIERIELIRIATFDSDGNLTPQQVQIVSIIKQHLLAVLRLTHDVDIQEFRQGVKHLGIGTKDIDGKPDMHIRIEVLSGGKRTDWENVRNTFLNTTEMKHLIVLIGDVQNGALPLQYRYLSLYRAFELEFRTKGRWLNLHDVFAPIDNRYKDLKLSKLRLVSLFHQLRDSCAHIRTGSEDKLGIVGLAEPDAHFVEQLLPLLTGILINHVNGKYRPVQFARLN